MKYGRLYCQHYGHSAVGSLWTVTCAVRAVEVVAAVIVENDDPTYAVILIGLRLRLGSVKKGKKSVNKNKLTSFYRNYIQGALKSKVQSKNYIRSSDQMII